MGTNHYFDTKLFDCWCDRKPCSFSRQYCASTWQLGMQKAKLDGWRNNYDSQSGLWKQLCPDCSNLEWEKSTRHLTRAVNKKTQHLYARISKRKPASPFSPASDKFSSSKEKDARVKPSSPKPAENDTKNLDT